jgi:hypothetical protein
MSGQIIPGSLDSATVADVELADLYVGPVTWIGERGDGDALKVVYERFDGGFETFTLGELHARAWWRLGRPEDVVSIETLMRSAHGRGMPSTIDDRGPHAAHIEHRKEAIRTEQARVRAHLAAA